MSRFSIVHFYPSNRTDKSAKDAPTRSGCPTTKLLHAKATVQGWLELYSLHTLDQNHRVRQAGAGGWSWSSVREKYYYLAGGWRLELE